MRIRKKTELLEEDEILLIADVSDALAHPARVKLFQHIMKCNKNMTVVCNKDLAIFFTISQKPQRSLKSILDTSFKIFLKHLYCRHKI